MWNLENARKEVYDALMMQNPYQLDQQPGFASREIAEASNLIPRPKESGKGGERIRNIGRKGVGRKCARPI